MILDNMVSEISNSSGKVIQGVDNTLNIGIVSNPQEMVSNQFLLLQYASYLSYGSSMLKMYRDLVGGIIAKI